MPFPEKGGKLDSQTDHVPSPELLPEITAAIVGKILSSIAHELRACSGDQLAWPPMLPLPLTSSELGQVTNYLKKADKERSTPRAVESTE